MIRRLLPLVLLVALVACGGDSSPSAPSPSPSPSPQTFTLSGRVTNSQSGAGVSGATVTVVDGPNAGRSAVADGDGAYRVTGLQSSGFTARARAQFFTEHAQGVTLTADRVADFALAPIPLFSRAGVGDTVFDMPLHVERVHVRGTYTGFCQNFIVWTGGRLLVNEILGRCSTAIGPTYDAIRLTEGGVTEIRSSSGVSWQFTEVR